MTLISYLVLLVGALTLTLVIYLTLLKGVKLI
uniref:Cytochrome b6-f complex subunit 6 n=1 Tax=Aphanochaete elegans TaxID=764105 RepID=A0A6H1XDP6_9CHLO|nr:subunit VI of cytochrome b6/f complex [Aphanochaete elegans]QJA13743.1 subunit VI of cytochrome b6/f complex [Aphanochaete elegans]